MARVFAAACAAVLALGAAPAGLRVESKPYLGIPVLLFHQVSNNPVETAHGVDRVQRPWATPAEFDELLSRLEAQGYRTISCAQLASYVDGATPASALPEKPFVITFDDGYRSALTEATVILQKHHFSATMFFEGHAVDNPLMPRRLSSSDLQAMARSGAWELESHGFAGHSDLRIDAKGTLSPYWYANLAYLPDKHRLETHDEYERRVEDDLRRMRMQFKGVAPNMDIFAYPSGEFGQNAPLREGEDPRTRIEAGHSDDSALTPLLIEALKHAGYRAAVAVSLPDEAHAAGRVDSIWEIPRIGVGAGFTYAMLANLLDPGTELPEDASGHFLDVAPLCATRVGIYAASTVRPVIYLLDDDGKIKAQTETPELIAGRADGSPAIGGLACSDSTLYVSQQAGFNPKPQPYLARYSIETSGALRYEGRDALPAAMNWMTGIAFAGGMLYGIDDRGTLFNIKAGTVIAVLDADIKDGGNRFTGLAPLGSNLLTFDRKQAQLLAFSTSGTVVSRTQLSADTRALAVNGTTLYSSNVRPFRRTLCRYELESGL